jgi:hypothetical protein
MIATPERQNIQLLFALFLKILYPGGRCVYYNNIVRAGAMQEVIK